MEARTAGPAEAARVVPPGSAVSDSHASPAARLPVGPGIGRMVFRALNVVVLGVSLLAQ